MTWKEVDAVPGISQGLVEAVGGFLGMSSYGRCWFWEAGGLGWNVMPGQCDVMPLLRAAQVAVCSVLTSYWRGYKTHCKILWFYPRGHRSQENAMQQWLSLAYFFLVLSLKQKKSRRYKAFHLAGAPHSWPMVSGFPPSPSFPSCLSGSVTAPRMAASRRRETTLRKSYAGTYQGVPQQGGWLLNVACENGNIACEVPPWAPGKQAMFWGHSRRNKHPELCRPWANNSASAIVLSGIASSSRLGPEEGVHQPLQGAVPSWSSCALWKNCILSSSFSSCCWGTPSRPLENSLFFKVNAFFKVNFLSFLWKFNSEDFWWEVLNP